MELTVNQRVIMLKNELDLRDIEFCSMCKISVGTLHKLKNDQIVAKKTIDLICERLNLNNEFIYNGTGEKFRDEKSFTPKVNGWKDEAFVKMEQYNESLKKEVDFLKEIIATLLPPSNSKQSFQIASVGTGRILEFCDTSVRVAG
jgi:hypothetical protein